MAKVYTSVAESGRGRKKYATGAVRDPQTGKGRFDLLSPFAEERQARHMENGARKYHDRNWEKGIPFSRCLDSAKRHINAYVKFRLLGKAEMAEDHLAAAVWNLQAIQHFEVMIEEGLLPPELDDLPNSPYKRKQQKKRKPAKRRR